MLLVIGTALLDLWTRGQGCARASEREEWFESAASGVWAVRIERVLNVPQEFGTLVLVAMEGRFDYGNLASSVSACRSRSLWKKKNPNCPSLLKFHCFFKAIKPVVPTASNEQEDEVCVQETSRRHVQRKLRLKKCVPDHLQYKQQWWALPGGRMESVFPSLPCHDISSTTF